MCNEVTIYCLSTVIGLILLFLGNLDHNIYEEIFGGFLTLDASIRGLDKNG